MQTKKEFTIFTVVLTAWKKIDHTRFKIWNYDKNEIRRIRKSKTGEERERDIEASQSEICQFENKGCSVVRMKPRVALIMSLISEFLKSNFLNKNVLLKKAASCVKICGSIVCVSFKRVSLWNGRFAQWRKKGMADSIVFSQLHRVSLKFWKLCLNLRFFNMLLAIWILLVVGVGLYIYNMGYLFLCIL